MLHVMVEGEGSRGRPALVMMHFLGGSGREWDEVVALLGTGYRMVRVDLPGFGGSADETGYTVGEMADAVMEAVEGQRLGRFVLVGHSMSGKVAMVIARRLAEGGYAGAGVLAGLVLVAGSPPGPEPMTEEGRGGKVALLGTVRDGDFDRARSYISKNEERDIPKAVEDRAVNEVLRMNRTAWVAWLTHGSREDWAARVGILEVPARVVAGEKDAALGPEGQRRVTLPHLSEARLCVVEGCSHLVPMERPEEMARILREFVEELEGKQRTAVPTEYVALLEGERVSARTREVLERRMAGPEDSKGVLSVEQEEALRAMLARVIPQAENAVDVAGFVMAGLARGKGDGWRYEVLPVDVTAYREGLDGLVRRGFVAMTAGQQDAILTEMDAEKGSAAARWFEEVRGDAVSAYVAYPATLARLGYSGIGVGGAATKYKGFVQLGPNEREDWEPVALDEAVR